VSFYLCSDVHGELDRFEALLRGINLGGGDKLVILGDAVDRGPEPIRLLQRIMDTENIILLLGNHEDMLIKYLLGEKSAEDYGRLGGGTTIEALRGVSKVEKNRILEFLQICPDCMDLHFGDERMHLVHAMPSDCRRQRLWGRPGKNSDFANSGFSAVIFGHTPTPYFGETPGEHHRIWYGRGACCIDCGCGNLEDDRRRLAVLHLPDMTESYF